MATTAVPDVLKKCSKCNETLDIKCFSAYTDKRNEKLRYQSRCKPCCVKLQAVRAHANPEKAREYKRNWKQRNPDRVRQNERDRIRNRRKVDKAFAIREELKSHLHATLFRTRDPTDAKIGCSASQLRAWIQYQFELDMDWSNHGRSGWSFDHVVPWTFFDLTVEAEQNLASNWTNIRPLKLGENRAKTNQIIMDEILGHIEKVKEFIKDNPGYQTSTETCWWQRNELWYGKNPSDCKDNLEFEEFLRRTIRNQACFFDDKKQEGSTTKW